MTTQTSTRAVEIAFDVARRVTRPDLVEAAPDLIARQTAYPFIHRWRPDSLATGDLGNALLCAVLDEAQPDEGWDRRGRAGLAQGVDGLARGQGLLSLYSGLSGAISATTLLGREGTRYQRMLAELDRTALPTMRAAARRVAEAPDVDVPEYDLISGVAGWAAALSLRPATGEVGDTLRELADVLATLLDDRDGRPRLLVPARHLEPDLAAAAPGGNEDCGLAHGVPGVLATLALLVSDGLVEPTDEVLRGLDWGARRLAAVADDLEWPSMLLRDEDGRAAPSGNGGRWGWCYGTPGVAWGLWVAGRTLGETRFQDLAAGAMRRLADRRSGPTWPESPTICHGIAGVMLLADSFARATGDEELRLRTGELVDEVAGHYDPELPFGFQDVENQGNAVDNPGLLNGAAGISLALLTVADVAPRQWLRLFLLG
ncbi:lanthionine synthetase C family protein [Streptomyces sp. ID05-26A]|nr:lanthionine synthetase C family protein [Streptomyces sp. ID05-26A]